MSDADLADAYRAELDPTPAHPAWLTERGIDWHTEEFGLLIEVRGWQMSNPTRGQALTLVRLTNR